MERREAIALLLAFSAELTALSGCATTRPSRITAGRGPEPVSTSFARRLLDAVQRSTPPGPALLEHPALAALLRHQRLSGTEISAEDLCDQLLRDIPDPAAARRVLSYWEDRRAQLIEAARRSGRYLPSGAGFQGTVFLVVGYDIGVAAPPDIALNVGHPRFVERPAELAFYATHEAHHVGFLGLRAMPSLPEAFSSAAGLRQLVRFLTQMEGMAVHAVAADREAAGALGDDPDYGVYLNEEDAALACADYGGLWASIQGDDPLDPSRSGAVLEAMSSGGRLWYRFGALVADRLERQQGREALIASIADPERYWRVALAAMPEPEPPSLLDLSPIVLAAPPWQRELRRRTGFSGAPPPVPVQRSSRRNQITDDAPWFEAVGAPALWPSVLRSGAPSSPPTDVPAAIGSLRLIRRIVQDGYRVAMYGPTYGGGPLLGALRGEEPLVLLDFSAWTRAPQVTEGDEDFVEQWPRWAVVREDVLFVSLSHRTYARSSGGVNAQLAALDLASGELLWRSQPLVCNSGDFLLVGDHILCGYGFTAERDYLHVLDQDSGALVSRTLLRSGPSWLALKDGDLHVRCYDTDYVFALR